MKKAQFFYKNPAAPKPNKPNHIGVAAIIRNEDYLLLERRTDSNRWSLVGGGLQKTESLEDCLKREVLEETGVEITTFQMFDIFSDPSRIVAYPDGNVLRIVTVAYIVNVPNNISLVCSEESLQLKFVLISDLSLYDIVETHSHIIGSYLERNPCLQKPI
ncbi:NUDIX domain-containing protein [Bacillus niameyensis]|uniref:NUDIX domain-containing protein n=1 Tax=Bacillus niameyensis TaxID=1522308 RepID=UPI000784C501|nr:NUDIX domain-containing protein [Bacillus niameyensis]